MKNIIIARTSTVNAFLNSIKDFEILTPEKEEELFIRIADGDEEARNIVINSNQRFVFSIAKEYAKDETILDFVNEGNFGLMKAIEKFDYTRGFKFITYAKDMIRAYMNMYAAELGLVRKSNNTKYSAKLKSIKAEFLAKNEREATIDEIVDIFHDKYGIDIVNTNDLLDINMTRINDSYDEDGATIEENSEMAVRTASHNNYEDEMDKEEDNTLIGKCLKTLDERSRQIIKMSFGIGYENPICDDDIAEELGLTTVRIRQIKHAAIKTMQISQKSLAKSIK